MKMPFKRIGTALAIDVLARARTARGWNLCSWVAILLVTLLAERGTLPGQEPPGGETPGRPTIPVQVSEVMVTPPEVVALTQIPGDWEMACPVEHGVSADEYKAAVKAIAKLGGTVENQPVEMEDTCDDENQQKSRNKKVNLCVCFTNSSLTDGELLSLTGALATIYRHGPEPDRDDLEAGCTLIKGHTILDVSFTKVTGKGLRYLCEATKVDKVDLSSTLVFDEGLLELTGIDSLVGVYLDYTHLSITTVQQFLKGQRKISDLSFSGVTFVEDGHGARNVRCLLDSLKDVQHLKTLDLSRLGIKDNDLLEVIPADNRWMTLDLSFNQLSDKCLPSLARLAKLRSLYLSGNKKLTGQSQEEWTSLSKKLTSLFSLDLSGTGITNELLTSLQFNSLQALDISDTITMWNEDVYLDWSKNRDGLERQWYEGPAVSNRFKSLKRLDISKTGVSDKELPAIEKLVKLQILDISDTTVTLEQLEALVKNLPDLKRINFPGQADITEHRLETVRANFSLRSLRFKEYPTRERRKRGVSNGRPTGPDSAHR